MVLRDRHTRIVFWLRILLPLAALAILSTLFLVSRRVSDPTNLPFAEVEIEDRARRQQVTRPSLSGASNNGDLITVSAATIRQGDATAQVIVADTVTARIDFHTGGHIDLSARTADFDRRDSRLTLRDAVRITTSSGQDLRAEVIEIEIPTLFIRAPQGLSGTGGRGDWTAGRMSVDRDVTTDDVQLVFTDGVKLIYRPNTTGRHK